MKIVHLGNMGIGTVLTSALRKIGHESLVVVDTPHPFGFKEDIVIFPGKKPSHFRTAKILKTLFSIRNVDVFHMHGLQSPIYLKAIRLSASKKVFHYHSSFDEPRPPDGIFQVKFVSMPTRLKAIENSVWIPLPVDTETMKIPEPKLCDEVTIGVGAGSTDPAKGKLLQLDLITKAVENIKGKRIKIREYKGYKHHNVLEYWKEVDIWVDRFYTGFYGWSAVEAASCGIPVLCQIDEDTEQYIPECPFLRTEPTEASIRSNIEYLMYTSDREMIGKKSREFVVRKHDSKIVAQKCVEEYSKIS